jgi:YbbR domain-containing protein
MLPRLALQWRRVATPLALAVVSLVAAVVLWIAVTEAENPNQVTVFSGSIEVRAVNVPDGLAVASITDPVVNLRISAPENTIKRLTSADFRADVDLAGVRQNISDQRVIARVVTNKDVKVVDVEPPVVSVTLEPLTTKNVPVQPNLIGTVRQGYSVDQQQIDASPAQVRISGAESRVRQVAYAAADINLTGLTVSTKADYTLVPRDSHGGEVRGVTVDPATSSIRVPVTQQEVTLALTIVPTFQGVVADGYNLTGLSTDPPAVAVSGPLEILQALSYIQTEPVDVTGMRADTTRTVRLRLPAGLQSQRDSVNVRLHIVPAQGEIQMTVVPQMTNVPEGLKPQLLVPSVSLRLAGDLPTLAKLTTANVKVTVNLNGLGEGVQVLKPSVSVPEGIQVRSADPSEVTVSLQR